MSETAEAFAELVHMILTVDKSAEKNIEAIAHKMGIKADKLRSRLRGDHQRTNFTLEETKGLIRALEDVRVVDFFLEGTPFIAAKRAVPITKRDDGRPDQDTIKEIIRDGADEAVLEAADILQAVVNGLKDKKLCHNDKSKISKEIEDAERTLSSLKLTLDSKS